MFGQQEQDLEVLSASNAIIYSRCDCILIEFIVWMYLMIFGIIMTYIRIRVVFLTFILHVFFSNLQKYIYMYN